MASPEPPCGWRAIKAEVDLPANTFLSWGGEFENQQRAMGRLSMVVPIAILAIFFLLYTAFRSLRQATLAILILPLATLGGIAALWLRGLHLSVSASIGFIALFGIAVLNGIELVSTINKLREEGDAHSGGCHRGSHPTASPHADDGSLGFTPMALSTGTGAEVQSPLATVVIGGLITATLLTLYVLPTLYIWFERVDQPIPLPLEGVTHDSLRKLVPGASKRCMARKTKAPSGCSGPSFNG